MSKPYEHAILSAKKWGGTAEDYLAVHNFMDSSKAHVADMRHRAILHSSFGIYLAEQVFGTNIAISMPGINHLNGVLVSVRDIAEQHVIQDLGFIPSVQQYLDHMTLADWMGGKKKKKFTILLKGQVEPEHKLSPETVQMLRNAAANGSTLDAAQLENAKEPEDLWGERSTHWKRSR